MLSCFSWSSLVTGPKFHTNIIGSGFGTIFVRDLTRRSGILSFEFCPISRDWGELGIPNMA